jgi:MoaA/NifB/PqqE/SkfB family radical SAM enzyme
MFLDNNIIEKQKRISSIYFPDYSVNELYGLLNDLYRLDTAKLVKEIRKIITRAQGLNVNLSFLPGVRPRDIPKYYLELDTFVLSKRCIYPWYSVRINPYGEVHPCFEYSAGNLRDQTLREIYNGSKMRYFRRILRKKRLFPVCARCCKL